MAEPFYSENLRYIQSPVVRSEYAKLRDLGANAGLNIEFVPRAAGRTMKLLHPELGREGYLFSADRARQHLSFYVRSHATRRWPDLMTRPLQGGEVLLESEQVRFKVVSSGDVARIWQWLEVKLATTSKV